MPYRYLEEIATADAAFEVRAATLDELFRDAGDAVLGVMVEDPDTVAPRVSRALNATADTLDLLLFQVLQELVYYKDAESLLLRFREAAVTPLGDGYAAEVDAWGEPIDPARHELLRDVKAITLHRLSLARVDGNWEATVIVDI